MKINNNADGGASTEFGALRPTYASYAVTTDEPDECVLTYLSSPLGKDETIKYACYPVANVYKGTGIAATDQSAAVEGVKIVASLRQTWSVVAEEADTVSAPNYKIPVTAQVSITVPKNEYISSSDLYTLLRQATGTLFDSTGAHRLAKLVRGSVRPSEV